MAAYAATTTLDTDRGERISRNFGMVMGKCDITNYNTTGAEITDITKYFRKVKRVITDGFSDNGYMVRWNTTDKCFHAYYPRAAQAAVTTSTNSLIATTGSATASAVDATTPHVTTPAGFRSAVNTAAGSEVVSDVDVGEVNFLALGLI